MPYDVEFDTGDEPQAREVIEMERLKQNESTGGAGGQTVCEHECCSGGVKSCPDKVRRVAGLPGNYAFGRNLRQRGSDGQPSRAGDDEE